MNPADIKISIYKNARDNVGNVTTAGDAIEIIATGKLMPFVVNIQRYVREVAKAKEQLQTATDAEEIESLKKKIKEYQWTVDETKRELPAVTWSGLFAKRSIKDLTDYSSLICIDIDKLPTDEQHASLKQLLKDDPYTWLLFTSPSGKGIKIIVKVKGTAEDHKNNFLALEQYYNEKYQINIDPSGKDISRLCFLSADNDFRCNYDSDTFSADLVTTKTPEPAPEIKPLSKKEEKEFSNNTDSLEWVYQFTNKISNYSEGNRNNYIFLFACNANRKGFDINETLDYAGTFASDMDIKELSETIRKAYHYNVAEHGKYKKQHHAPRPAKRNTESGNNDRQPVSNTIIPGNTQGNYTNGHVPDFTIFWNEIKIEKGKGEQKYTTTRLELFRVAFMKFLQQQGFFIIETGKEGYQICQRTEGVIRTVDPRKIKNHVYDWCHKQGDRTLYTKVEEMLRKGQKNYFAYTDLESLKVFIPDFVRDTQDEAFFFFQNCFVKITKDDITTHQLNDVTKAIWDTSIIKRNFTLVPSRIPQNESGYFDIEKIDSDIEKFIVQVATNPKKYTEIESAIVVERFQSICSAIGYMLHGYKNPVGKAVLAVDHKMPGDKTEQNGGTGKSIVGKSFKYLKGVSELDGRDFDEKYPFRFESIDIDTKIVVMADCKYNLDFGSFFNPITSDFRFNKRHTGYITIPYEDSPKWWFDTNFVFKGEGASYRRRQHIIEFDDYYNDSYNPLDEFNHMLFNDWNDTQWNKFYNFYFKCVQLYLHNGLMSYTASNYDSRKLLVESNQEFIDWLDAADSRGIYKIPRNEWLSKKELLKQWNEEAKSLNMTTISPHSFSKWVKKYCTTKGFEFHSRKSNSVEYYMIARKGFKAETAVIVQELFNDPETATTPNQWYQK